MSLSAPRIPTLLPLLPPSPSLILASLAHTSASLAPLPFRPLLTLILVDPHDDDGLCLADPDEFVDGADAPPRQLREQDHALDVVVLEQTHVGAHLGDLTHRHHHHVVDLRKFLRVKSARQRHGGSWNVRGGSL